MMLKKKNHVSSGNLRKTEVDRIWVNPQKIAAYPVSLVQWSRRTFFVLHPGEHHCRCYLGCCYLLHNSQMLLTEQKSKNKTMATG